LKLCFKGDLGVSRFAGFRQDDFQTLKEHMQRHYGAALVEQQVSTKGCSWFDWNLDNSHELRLMIEGKNGFEVPLEDLSQVTTLGKNELNIEFQDEASMFDDEVIHEMRFALPTGDVPTELTAERLKEELQKRTRLSATGEAIARITDIVVVQPRGKHDFEFFQQAVKVHGKTQTYTIKYASITKAFLLELPGGQLQLVIHLDPPLRPNNNQLLSYIVLNFDKERKVTVELPADMLTAMRVTAGEEHPVYSLVAKLVTQLSKKALIAPTTEFKNLLRDGECSVRCSVKTQPGYLFPTKRSMIFVPKPVIWIRYDEIEGIEFKSSSMRKSSFDLVVQTKRQQVVEFSQLDRLKVLKAVYEFFRKVEVRITNNKEVEAWLGAFVPRTKQPSLPAASSSGAHEGKPGADDDEEDDEDYNEASDAEGSSAGEEEDEEEDPFEEEEEPQKKRPKRDR